MQLAVKKQNVNQPGGLDEVKKRLINAGFEIFSKYNFEGASIRMLAKRAEVNLAAISYHFGGKEGLYQATISEMVRMILERIAPVIKLAETKEENKLSKKECFESLCQLISCLVGVILGTPEARLWQSIMLKEQREPTPSFSIIYNNLMNPLKNCLSQLVGRIKNLPPEHPKVLLTTVTIMGQVLIFRIGREMLVRTLGWEGYSEKEINLVKQTILENMALILEIKKLKQKS